MNQKSKGYIIEATCRRCCLPVQYLPLHVKYRSTSNSVSVELSPRLNSVPLGATAKERADKVRELLSLMANWFEQLHVKKITRIRD